MKMDGTHLAKTQIISNLGGLRPNKSLHPTARL